MDRHLIAAVCLAAASLLWAWCVLQWSTNDELHPPPVRLEDRSTWRRPNRSREYLSHAAGFSLVLVMAAAALMISERID